MVACRIQRLGIVLAFFALSVGPNESAKGFSAAPLTLGRAPRVIGRHGCQNALSFKRPQTHARMTFLSGEPMNETVVPSKEQESSASSFDLVDASSDYSVTQTSALPWYDQPSVTMGRLLALFAAAIYGTNFASVKILSDSLPVSLGASLRFGLGALGVSIIVLVQEYLRDKKDAGNQFFQVYESGEEILPVSKAELHKERLDATLAGMEVGGWYSIGFIAQAIALLEVDASKSAFFNAAAILVVPVLDACFKGKKIGLPGAISITLAMFGMGLLQLGGGALNDSTFRVSDALCLCQALFFGIGYWRLENSASGYPGQAGRITMGQLLGVAGGAFAYSVAVGLVPPPEAIWLTLLHLPLLTVSLLWTGLGSTALAIYLETVALKAISATELTILMASVSLWGSAFAYVTMGEVLSPTGMAGGALLLAGCLVSSLMGEKESELETSFVLGEDATTTLVSEGTEYESIEEAIASDWDAEEEALAVGANVLP